MAQIALFYLVQCLVQRIEQELAQVQEMETCQQVQNGKSVLVGITKMKKEG